ncbi:hypothetical protein [Aeromicrobium flavum]|uniref:hypothetical protein n=1 Tax=Aeromicrobium flavum TaxID=416568 RepID=UPI0016497F79|nr:hypothetical protein [Aeromicrobium flavum]
MKPNEAPKIAGRAPEALEPLLGRAEGLPHLVEGAVRGGSFLGDHGAPGVVIEITST